MVPFFLQSEICIVLHEFCRIIPTVFKITKYSLRILQNFFTRVRYLKMTMSRKAYSKNILKSQDQQAHYGKKYKKQLQL